MGNRESETNYGAWFFTIAAAVTLGNLASTWIAATVATYQLNRFAVELQHETAMQTRRARETSAARTRETQAAKAAQRQAIVESRRADAIGMKLARICSDWRVADAELNTTTTRAESRKHCGHYERYLEFGKLPPRT